MRLETRKYLDDMQRAAGLLAEFTSGKSLADYERDAMVRAAVERQFERGCRVGEQRGAQGPSEHTG